MFESIISHPLVFVSLTDQEMLSAVHTPQRPRVIVDEHLNSFTTITHVQRTLQPVNIEI